MFALLPLAVLVILAAIILLLGLSVVLSALVAFTKVVDMLSSLSSPSFTTAEGVIRWMTTILCDIPDTINGFFTLPSIFMSAPYALLQSACQLLYPIRTVFSFKEFFTRKWTGRWFFDDPASTRTSFWFHSTAARSNFTEYFTPMASKVLKNLAHVRASAPSLIPELSNPVPALVSFVSNLPNSKKLITVASGLNVPFVTSSAPATSLASLYKSSPGMPIIPPWPMDAEMASASAASMHGTDEKFGGDESVADSDEAEIRDNYYYANRRPSAIAARRKAARRQMERSNAYQTSETVLIPSWPPASNSSSSHSLPFPPFSRPEPIPEILTYFPPVLQMLISIPYGYFK